MSEFSAMRVTRDASDITIIIKTFERPEALKASYLSIRTFYPSAPIIIVDDSRRAMETGIFDSRTTYLKTNFNIYRPLGGAKPRH